MGIDLKIRMNSIASHFYIRCVLWRISRRSQSITDHSSHQVSIYVALFMVSAVVMYRLYQYNSVIFLIRDITVHNF